MKFKEYLRTINEELGNKNKKVWDEHEDEIEQYSKKQIYDIRNAEAGEMINVNFDGEKPKKVKTRDAEYIVRAHDDPEQIKVISDAEFKHTYTPVRDGQELDAEGFKQYREAGYYDAFEYQGEDVYIFTDWNTKQQLRNGDYLVRDSDNRNDSGFVVPAVEFEANFEQIK